MKKLLKSVFSLYFMEFNFSFLFFFFFFLFGRIPVYLLFLQKEKNLIFKSLFFKHVIYH